MDYTGILGLKKENIPSYNGLLVLVIVIIIIIIIQ